MNDPMWHFNNEKIVEGKTILSIDTDVEIDGNLSYTSLILGCSM